MPSFLRFSVLSLLFLLLVGFSRAADGSVKAPGLAVGAKAPSFSLKQADGSEVSLAQLVAKGPVALVFFRSVEWCPYCIAQMKDLEGRLPDFAAAGLQIVGISYDKMEALAQASKKHGLTMPLLADTGSKTIEAYGIRNETASGRAAGIPHPMVFVLDTKGVIRAKLQRDGYKERPEADEIIAAAKGLR